MATANGNQLGIIGGSVMKVGDLVKCKYTQKIGVIWEIGYPVPIARIIWTDGGRGATNIKYLEAV